MQTPVVQSKQENAQILGRYLGEWNITTAWFWCLHWSVRHLGKACITIHKHSTSKMSKWQLSMVSVISVADILIEVCVIFLCSWQCLLIPSFFRWRFRSTCCFDLNKIIYAAKIIGNTHDNYQLCILEELHILECKLSFNIT